jgi:hypothetical protein
MLESKKTREIKTRKIPKSRSAFATKFFQKVAKLSEALQVSTLATYLLQNHTEFLLAQVN